MQQKFIISLDVFANIISQKIMVIEDSYRKIEPTISFSEKYRFFYIF